VELIALDMVFTSFFRPVLLGYMPKMLHT